MAQRLVNVIKAFSLNLNRTGTPETLDFPTGVQHVDEGVAEHWYAKAHFGPMPGEDASISVETAAALTELRAREEALAGQERDLVEREEQLTQVRDDLRTQLAALDQRDGELSKRADALDALASDLKAREDKLAAAEQSASTGRKAGAK